MTLEPVLLEELATLRAIVVEGTSIKVVVEVGLIVVVTPFATFATGSVVVTTGVFFRASVDVGIDVVDLDVEATGVAGFEVAVSVRIRTNNSSGLDHVTQCVLLRERNSLMGVFED